MPLIPTSWLGDHVELPDNLSAADLAAALVKVGLEEEEIHRPDISGPIVVGKVLTMVTEQQKNGKKINYCRVDVGQHNDAPGDGKEPADIASRGIICGAHNFGVGDHVVVSLPGATLPGDFRISARKTYGHISDGMICSVTELGIGEDSSGILVLAKAGDEEAAARIPAPGEDVLDYLGLTGETLEINITPDRGYCFSMRGVAREYAHSTGATFTDPGLPAALTTPIPEPNATHVVVDDVAPIHDVVGCSRFVTRTVRGIDPAAPTPSWMAERLTEAGMRPISLAVDVTNYVMLDLGQPLHAYDLDTLSLPIVVRRARDKETLTTLDNSTLQLAGEDLVITDTGGERAIGLAGVMGGLDTEVTESTSNILIEAAHFDPVSIARSARRHRLPTEAAKRFERGVDPNLPPVAAQRVAELLVEYGGGTIDKDVTDVNTTVPLEAIAFDLSEVRRLTGLELTEAEIQTYLTDIGCTLDGVLVTPPSWRSDLVGPAHLVEEVARLAGYDAIDSILPAAPAGRGLTVDQRRRRDIMRTLVEAGWTEVLSYPFVSQSTFDNQGIAADDPRRIALRLANPLQDEAPLLRTSILDSLLHTAALNVGRSNPEVAVVEGGLVAHPEGITPAPVYPGGVRPSAEELDRLDGATPAQPYHIAGVAAPTVRTALADLPEVRWDWRDAIEAVVSAARTIGATASVSKASRAPFHPGRTALITVGQTEVGYAGEIAPAVCQAFGLPPRSLGFEFSVTALSQARGTAPIGVVPVGTQPVAKEDIALVVSDTVEAATIEQIIREAGGELLESVSLFDVYTGDQVGQGKKSLAFSMRFRSDHTLNAEEIAAVRNKIVKRASGAGASLRS